MHNSRPSFPALCAALTLLSIGASQSCFAATPAPVKTAAPVPKGERILGIAAQAAEDNDYGKAFSLAQAAGLQSTTLALDWQRIEDTPGSLKNDYLAISNAYYPASHTKIDLILRPINTNNKNVPSDLTDTAFDSPMMIERFKKVLDYVFSQIPDLDLDSLAIGNEVDAYLAKDSKAWKQYETFYNAEMEYAKTKRPGLKVGVVATFDGLTGDARAHLQALNKNSDVIMVSYYPLKAGYTVKDPSVVGPDFDRMTKLCAGRPIIMTEVGYPTSALCHSSEARQAAFIHNVFKAWDAHSTQIRSLTISWLTDISPVIAASYSRYYGASATAFVQFISTLGLRTFDGSGKDKKGYAALKEEAKKRGW